MSDKKQRANQRKRDDGRGVSPAHGVVRDLATSHISGPAAHKCTLPEIGNGQLMCKQRGNILKHTGSSAKDSSHISPPPSKHVSQQKVKMLSKRSSVPRPSFKEQPLPADNCSKEGSQPKLLRLPPIESKARPDSRPAGRRPQTAVVKPSVVLNNHRELPANGNTRARCFRPRSGNLDWLPCVPGHGKKVKLPSIPSAQRAESHGLHK